MSARSNLGVLCVGMTSVAWPALGCAGDQIRGDSADSSPGVEGLSDAATDELADTSVDRPGDTSSDAEASEAALPRPDTLPSKQSVHLQVTTSGTQELWVVTVGASCWPYQVERHTPDGWRVLLLGWPNADPVLDECCSGQTGCDADGQGPRTMARLAPGGVVTIDWDARALVMSDETYACQAHPTDMFHWRGLQPVDPGDYRVTVGFESSLPDNCELADGGTSNCSVGFWRPLEFYPICATTYTAVATFTLPDDGDITVPFVLP